MPKPLTIECFICGLKIAETHPHCGEGWDLCERCRAKIVDSRCQDIPAYCPHCRKDLGEKEYMGTYTMPGDATHGPGKFWTFKCGCGEWSRCHESPNKTVSEALKELAEQREILKKMEKDEREGD